ncbi:MAG: riboflavin synthase [Bradymonadia bacterium]
MFTGLIEVTGRLRRKTHTGLGATLVIEAPRSMVSELTLGESVAVDGACLTVTHFGGDAFEVEASAETLDKTTLGDRQAGDGVHLERALKVGDRLGGHIVSGHVDATGTVRTITPLGRAQQMHFNVPRHLLRYLVPKGSITIDGISLTVNEVDDQGFSVVLIPHTQDIVQLHTRRVGERVNLEMDILGKYIERLLTVREGRAEAEHGGVDLEALVRGGVWPSGDNT